MVIESWGKYKLVHDHSGMQLINTNMEHKNKEPYGHIHGIKRISYAKKLVKVAKRKKVPHDLRIEFLEDLKRIVKDRRKRKKIEQLLLAKIDKAKSADYVNWQGG